LLLEKAYYRPIKATISYMTLPIVEMTCSIWAGLG
jgi:hypothetical protein